MLFQSSEGPIHISGSGFKAESVLVFDPPISSPDDYTLEVVSETELKLTLAKEAKWRTAPGPLMVKAINVGDGDVSTEICRSLVFHVPRDVWAYS